MADCTCPLGGLAHDCPRHGLKKGEKRGNKIPSKIAPSTKPIPKRGERQKERLKKWALIKRAMIFAQQRTDGFTSCMSCGLKNPRKLELDHIESTGRGGKWVPENAQLLCAGPGTNDCHGAKHSGPARRAS